MMFPGRYYTLHFLLIFIYARILYSVQWKHVERIRAVQLEVRGMHEKVELAMQHNYDFRLFLRRVLDIYARTGKKANIIIVFPGMEDLVDNYLCNLLLFNVMHRTSLLFFDEKLQKEYVKKEPLLNTGFMPFPTANASLPAEDGILVTRQVTELIRLGISLEISKLGIECFITIPTTVWSDNILSKTVDDRWGVVGLVALSHGTRATIPFQHNMDLNAFFVQPVQRTLTPFLLENAIRRIALQPFEANTALAAECTGRTYYRMCMRWGPREKSEIHWKAMPRRRLPYVISLPAATTEKDLQNKGFWFLTKNGTCESDNARIVWEGIRSFHVFDDEVVPSAIAPQMNNIAYTNRNQIVKDNYKFPFHFDVWRIK